MTGGLRLHKLHGLGNDFLVALVDELPDAADAARSAVEHCDRSRGIGADGLIYAVLDPSADGADVAATMRLWNCDGSPAEVSGNGLRCLAHAIARTLGVAELEIVVHTVAGPRLCSIQPASAPDTAVGTTEMGMPAPGPGPDRADPSPAAAAGPFLDGDAVERWEAVDMGNPHAVLSVADPAAVPVSEAGPAVEALFTGGINVHFGAVTGPDELTLGVWERGAGATAACGTGAVAAASAFHRWGRVGQNVTVRMAGGEARVDLSEPVTLTGESIFVATVDVPDA